MILFGWTNPNSLTWQWSSIQIHLPDNDHQSKFTYLTGTDNRRQLRCNSNINYGFLHSKHYYSLFITLFILLITSYLHSNPFKKYFFKYSEYAPKIFKISHECVHFDRICSKFLTTDYFQTKMLSHLTSISTKFVLNMLKKTKLFRFVYKTITIFKNIKIFWKIF